MESKNITIAATVLRLSLGWFMLVDGLQNMFTPGWTSAGFLMSAKTFPAFYAWFALPTNIWWVDPLNLWGITLIGVALLAGVAVRPSAWAGALLLVLYYFPHYTFPSVPHGFIIEDHLIEAAAFVLIAVLPAARSWGLGDMLRDKTFLGRIPGVRALI